MFLISLDDHDELQDPTIPGQDASLAFKNLLSDSVQPGQNIARNVSASGNQSLDGVLAGTAWSVTSISFSTPTSAAAYADGVSAQPG